MMRGPRREIQALLRLGENTGDPPAPPRVSSEQVGRQRWYLAAVWWRGGVFRILLQHSSIRSAWFFLVGHMPASRDRAESMARGAGMWRVGSAHQALTRRSPSVCAGPPADRQRRGSSAWFFDDRRVFAFTTREQQTRMTH